jgi:amino acid permease
MTKKLTFIEAISIIVGAGVGGGVMAVPYLASQSGLGAFVPVILAAFLLNVLLNLMLTEVLIRDGRDLQIVELMRVYVFRGRIGSRISWVFFAVLGLSFVASLTAYVSGAGEVVAQLTGIPPMWSRLMAYGFSALIVFFGLKSVGISEKVALGLLLGFSLLIGIGSIPAWDFPGETLGFGRGRWKESLALYGVVMYSLNAAFAVPQAVKGLGRDPRRSVSAVVAGTAINAALVILVTVVAIGVSRPVTEVAVIGIGAATGPVVSLAGSLFVIVAMLTTYWSVSLALSDIIDERLRLGRTVSWIAATAPTLVLIVFGLFGFVEYLQIAGGIVALVVVYVTVPMYLRARRERPLGESGWSLNKLASPVVLTVFVVAMVVMAVGSFLGI